MLLVNCEVLLSYFSYFTQTKTRTLKEKIKQKYDAMKRVLDEDLRITLSQLDIEAEAMEKFIEDRIEKCYHLTTKIDQQLVELSTQLEKDQEKVHLHGIILCACYFSIADLDP